MEQVLNAAIDIAREMGLLMGRLFRMPASELRMAMKDSDGLTPQTIIDRTVSRRIAQRIRERFPGHAITDEEAGASGTSVEWRWWTDPFDGTANVIAGLGMSVVGIAVAHRGTPVVAAVANPFEGTLTVAERGSGAHVIPLTDGDRRRVTVCHDRAVYSRFAVVDGLWNAKTAAPKARFLAALTAHVQNVRMVGSNILAWSLVAQGRIDVAFMDCVGGHWDTAPGLVLVPEAGGRITDLDGNTPQPGQYHVVLATNGELHDDILTIVRAYYADYAGFR